MCKKILPLVSVHGVVASSFWSLSQEQQSRPSVYKEYRCTGIETPTVSVHFGAVSMKFYNQISTDPDESIHHIIGVLLTNSSSKMT